MILDVARADLEYAEALLGPFHDTTWFFRSARDEAQRSWERLRAELGREAVEAALAEPPCTVVSLADQRAKTNARLILITGTSYRAEDFGGCDPAPRIWRLTHLHNEDDAADPYFVCRLRDGSFQCDCGGWTFARDESPSAGVCRHVRALRALGWL